MSELIAISALIGDRTYRIKIEPQDEEHVRKSLRLINEKILEFKTLYAGKDMQDYIAMALIWLSTENAAAASPGQDQLLEGLLRFEKQIDQQLGSSSEE